MPHGHKERPQIGCEHCSATDKPYNQNKDGDGEGKRCLKCEKKLELMGALPSLEYPAGVDSLDVLMCQNPSCERYGLLAMGWRQQ